MSNTTKTAVVVGGSLAGLMNALVLKDHGYIVHVLERSRSTALQSEAAGIRAGPEVHAFLEKYVPNHNADYAITAKMVEIMDGEENIVQKIPPKDPLRLTTWKAVYNMLKAELLSTTSTTSVATYHTGQDVQSVTEEDEKMSVRIRELDTEKERVLEADLVIAADGAHSTIRNKVSPGTSPQYAGYVTWRGTVPESALSTSTREALRDRCIIVRVEGGYQISYYVPADPSDLNSTGRDFVWVWYDTLPDTSPNLSETLTDINGRKHNTTIPRGKMQPQVWQRVLDRRNSAVNPYFIELMEKIELPFVSAIRDFSASKAVFFNGKLLLVGDAFAQSRPHGAGGTSQAALQATLLAKVLSEEMSLDEWEKTCLEESRTLAKFSLAMAQFLWHDNATPDLKRTVELVNS